MYKVGTTGIITDADGLTSKVTIVGKETYSMFPTDYWLEYDSDETHRPIIHPEFGKNPMIKAPILLPELLLFKVFTPNVIVEKEDDFQIRVDTYIENNFLDENKEEAKNLFDLLLKTKGKEHIEANYLNK